MTDVDPLGGLSSEAPRPETPAPRAPQRPERHRPPAAPTTLVLLALLGAMFLVEVTVGGKLGGDPLTLFRLGALSPAAVLDGDWWRLGSYAFLHAGPVHLLFNAYALWILMRPLEGMFGSASALERCNRSRCRGAPTCRWSTWPAISTGSNSSVRSS